MCIYLYLFPPDTTPRALMLPLRVDAYIQPTPDVDLRPRPAASHGHPTRTLTLKSGERGGGRAWFIIFYSPPPTRPAHSHAPSHDKYISRTNLRPGPRIGPTDLPQASHPHLEAKNRQSGWWRGGDRENKIKSTIWSVTFSCPPFPSSGSKYGLLTMKSY